MTIIKSKIVYSVGSTSGTNPGWGGLWSFATNGNAFPTADIAGKLYIAEDDHGDLGDADYVAAGAWMISKVAGANSFSQYAYNF